ncbi:MAG TPA: YraN family protein [Candidatus Paceibacterota bacterium]
MSPKYSSRRRMGNLGEDAAVQFLERKGFKILERNFLRPWGEIDIIAEKGGSVRFIEVKAVSRENSSYRPEEQVHPGKLRKLARTAEMYMNSREDDRDYQIDVVGVLMDMGRRIAHCRLFEQVL